MLPLADQLSKITGAVLAVVALQLVLVTKAMDLSTEGRRRIQHASTGQLLIVVSFLLPLWICTIALLAGLVLMLYVYYMHNLWYRKAFGSLLRPSEQDSLPGAFWFLVGTWIIAVFVGGANIMDMDIGRYAILCLSYADPMAAWVGSSIPSPRVMGMARSTVAGCAASFVTAFVIGIGMLEGHPGGNNNHPWLEIFTGAVACTLSESLPIGNDNLLIPIGTGLAVQLVRIYHL